MGKCSLNEIHYDDAGASFYKCGCVCHYDWGDTIPSNKWKHAINGDWWRLREWEDDYPRIGNYFPSRWVNMSHEGLYKLKDWKKARNPVPYLTEVKVLLT